MLTQQGGKRRRNIRRVRGGGGKGRREGKGKEERRGEEGTFSSCGAKYGPSLGILQEENVINVGGRTTSQHCKTPILEGTFKALPYSKLVNEVLRYSPNLLF